MRPKTANGPGSRYAACVTRITVSAGAEPETEFGGDSGDCDICGWPLDELMFFELELLSGLPMGCAV